LTCSLRRWRTVGASSEYRSISGKLLQWHPRRNRQRRSRPNRRLPRRRTRLLGPTRDRSVPQRSRLVASPFSSQLRGLPQQMRRSNPRRRHAHNWSRLQLFALGSSRRASISRSLRPERTSGLGRSIKQRERREWADCVEEVGSSSRVGTLGRGSAVPLKRGPAAGSGSAWRACGGFGRWRRGGTRPWHHLGPAGAGGPASGYA
jgi:hypothetical protein